MPAHSFALRLCAGACISLLGCASTPIRHPSYDKPIHGCYISCASGYSMRRQHLCRSTTRWMLNITITGEEDVAGDPEESRWFTGLSSSWADYEVRQRLAREPSLKPGTAAWSQRYGTILKDVQRELGDEAKATYNKQDVVLETCESYQRSQCLTSDNCASHPGEPDPRHPDRP